MVNEGLSNFFDTPTVNEEQGGQACAVTGTPLVTIKNVNKTNAKKDSRRLLPLANNSIKIIRSRLIPNPASDVIAKILPIQIAANRHSISL
jgi:hypothetical protein